MDFSALLPKKKSRPHGPSGPLKTLFLRISVTKPSMNPFVSAVNQKRAYFLYRSTFMPSDLTATTVSI